MGVASYNNIQVKEIQDQLPTIEELKNRIRLQACLLQKELYEKNNAMQTDQRKFFS